MTMLVSKKPGTHPVHKHNCPLLCHPSLLAGLLERQPGFGISRIMSSKR